MTVCPCVKERDCANGMQARERKSESERQTKGENDRQIDKEEKSERAHVSIHVYICTQMCLHDPVSSRTLISCAFIYSCLWKAPGPSAPLVCALSSTLGLQAVNDNMYQSVANAPFQ